MSPGTHPAVLNTSRVLLRQFNTVRGFLCWKTPKGFFSSTDRIALLRSHPGDVFGEKPMPAKPWLKTHWQTAVWTSSLRPRQTCHPPRPQTRPLRFPQVPPVFQAGSAGPTEGACCSVDPHLPCSTAPTCTCSGVWHRCLCTSALSYEQAGLAKPVAFGSVGVSPFISCPRAGSSLKRELARAARPGDLWVQARSDAEPPGRVSSQLAPTSPTCSHLWRSH